MTTLTDDFAYEVLSVVAEIPEGRVATYGQIARLVGKEKNARLVAKILSRAEYYGHFPCHRVVNHAGRLAPHWPEQAFLLFREGVDLKPDGCVAFYLFSVFRAVCVFARCRRRNTCPKRFF